MSLYSEFAQDAKDMIADFGIAGSATSLPGLGQGSITFKCLISDPAVMTVLEAGGYVERTQYSVRVPAVTAAWTLPDGSVGASGGTVGGDNVIQLFRQGAKMTIGGRGVRITTQTYKPASAWVTLIVIDDNQ
jgi:hypothetical protein